MNSFQGFQTHKLARPSCWSHLSQWSHRSSKPRPVSNGWKKRKRNKTQPRTSTSHFSFNFCCWFHVPTITSRASLWCVTKETKWYTFLWMTCWLPFYSVVPSTFTSSSFIVSCIMGQGPIGYRDCILWSLVLSMPLSFWSTKNPYWLWCSCSRSIYCFCLCCCCWSRVG